MKGPIVNNNECMTRQTVASIVIDPETPASVLATLPNGLRNAVFIALRQQFGDVTPKKTSPDAQVLSRSSG